MKVYTRIATHSFALIFSQILWLQPSHSQAPAVSQFKEEVSKQQVIIHSGDDKPGGYTIDRGLADYASALPPGFDRDLADLGPADRWLDIGAGEGQAILDYYTPEYDAKYKEGQARRGKKARAVAMSIEDRRTSRWRQKAANLEANQIQYLHNRSLREYSRDELGRFQVITDVIGGFSYTTDLSLFVQKVLGFLEVNGSFYTLLQDVHSEAGTNRPHYQGSPFLTQIKDSDGSEVKICAWLKSISCVQVTCELKSGWKPPIEAFHVKKVCDDTAVPDLAPVHYQAGTPPERGFQLRD